MGISLAFGTIVAVLTVVEYWLLQWKSIIEKFEMTTTLLFYMVANTFRDNKRS